MRYKAFHYTAKKLLLYIHLMDVTRRRYFDITLYHGTRNKFINHRRIRRIIHQHARICRCIDRLRYHYPVCTQIQFVKSRKRNAIAFVKKYSMYQTSGCNRGTKFFIDPFNTDCLRSEASFHANTIFFYYLFLDMLFQIVFSYQKHEITMISCFLKLFL